MRWLSAEHRQALPACVVRWGDLDIAEAIFTAGRLDAYVFRP